MYTTTQRKQLWEWTDRNRYVREHVSATGDGALAAVAIPDARHATLDVHLAAEGAFVLTKQTRTTTYATKTMSEDRAATCSARQHCTQCTQHRITIIAHLAVLRDLDLLHELTQGGTVARAILAADSDLLRALAHLC